jgi:hypothetical protein
VNTSELLAQLLNVAVTCNGKRHFVMHDFNHHTFLVFTVEHRRQLSNVADIHHPVVSHSPTSSISGHSSRHSTGTPDLVLSQSSRVASSQRPSLVSANVEFGQLANQFGVEPRLVEALAQKLSAMG